MGFTGIDQTFLIKKKGDEQIIKKTILVLILILIVIILFFIKINTLPTFHRMAGNDNIKFRDLTTSQVYQRVSELEKSNIQKNINIALNKDDKKTYREFCIKEIISEEEDYIINLFILCDVTFQGNNDKPKFEHIIESFVVPENNKHTWEELYFNYNISENILSIKTRGSYTEPLMKNDQLYYNRVNKTIEKQIELEK